MKTYSISFLTRTHTSHPQVVVGLSKSDVHRDLATLHQLAEQAHFTVVVMPWTCLQKAVHHNNMDTGDLHLLHECRIFIRAPTAAHFSNSVAAFAATLTLSISTVIVLVTIDVTRRESAASGLGANQQAIT